MVFYTDLLVEASPIFQSSCQPSLLIIRVSSFSFFVNLGQSKDDIIKCVVGLPEQSPQKSFIIINTLRFISMLLIQYLIMNNNRVLMREVLYVFMKTTLNLNKYIIHTCSAVPAVIVQHKRYCNIICPIEM